MVGKMPSSKQNIGNALTNLNPKREALHLAQIHNLSSQPLLCLWMPANLKVISRQQIRSQIYRAESNLKPEVPSPEPS